GFIQAVTQIGQGMKSTIQVGRTVNQQKCFHKTRTFMSLQAKLGDALTLEKPWSAKESWRVLGIVAEFVEGTERLECIQPAISIFGSARTHPDHPHYKLTEAIARQLSDAGFSVISGGGPGIMEAA